MAHKITASWLRDLTITLAISCQITRYLALVEVDPLLAVPKGIERGHVDRQRDDARLWLGCGSALQCQSERWKANGYRGQ